MHVIRDIREMCEARKSRSFCVFGAWPVTRAYATFMGWQG